MESGKAKTRMRKKREPVITTDEWLAELERVARDSGHDDGLTAQEIADGVGYSTKWVAVRLRRLKAIGRLQVGKRTIEALNGNRIPVPVYKVLPEKHK